MKLKTAVLIYRLLKGVAILIVLFLIFAGLTAGGESCAITIILIIFAALAYAFYQGRLYERDKGKSISFGDSRETGDGSFEDRTARKVREQKEEAKEKERVKKIAEYLGIKLDLNQE